jgi:hypothetical protein
VVWTDMQLGPQGSPRPDVFTIPKSFARFIPLAYEVKISVADFRRDVTSGKWQSYLQFASGVIFAVPAGLIKKEDVPPGCGLLVRHDAVWRAAKGPTLKATENLPRDAWIKLMIDGLDRQGHDPKPRTACAWMAEQAVRKKYGDKLARALSDLGTAENYLASEIEKAQQSTEQLREVERERAARARKQAEDEIGQIKKIKTELCAALGIRENANIWEIQSAARAAGTRLTEGEINRLRAMLERAKTVLDDGLEQLPVIGRAA